MTKSTWAEEAAKELFNKLREPISGTPHEMAMCELDEISLALRSARNRGLEEVLRIGDDNHPEIKDIHPQLQWFLTKVRALREVL